MIFAELAGRVAVFLQQTGDGRVLFLHAEIGAGKTDFREARAEYALPHDVGRSARGARLLAVVVGENHAFIGDTVDIRRAVADQTHRVGADVGLADVVTPDDQDIGLVLSLGHAGYERAGKDRQA